VFSYTHNEPALRTMEQRLSASALDSSNDIEGLKRHFSGSLDAQIAKESSASVLRHRAAAEELRPSGGVSYAIALSNQVEATIELDHVQGGTDPENIVQLATQAFQAAPSNGTRRLLVNALEFRAHKRLRKAIPEFDAFAEKYHRTLGYPYLLACVV